MPELVNTEQTTDPKVNKKNCKNWLLHQSSLTMTTLEYPYAQYIESVLSL